LFSDLAAIAKLPLFLIDANKAYVSLTLVPAVIFFFALQKYIVAGLTGGAVKE
jgi:raffinose/stachyose/melibiose transport system permease protein